MVPPRSLRVIAVFIYFPPHFSDPASHSRASANSFWFSADAGDAARVRRLGDSTASCGTPVPASDAHPRSKWAFTSPAFALTRTAAIAGVSVETVCAPAKHSREPSASPRRITTLGYRDLDNSIAIVCRQWQNVNDKGKMLASGQWSKVFELEATQARFVMESAGVLMLCQIRTNEPVSLEDGRHPPRNLSLLW